MAAIINYITWGVAGIGIYFGFNFISDNPSAAIRWVTFSTVGIIGVLSYVRHFLFHKSDAKRMGWETDRPEWMFEVAFANLAFGIIGLLTSIHHYDIQTPAIVVLGYAIYLFQAGILHGYLYFKNGSKSTARLWTGCIATLIFSGMMLYFAVRILLI